jgi:hypothetical protein
MRTPLLWAHLVCGACWLGANVLQLVVARSFERHGDTSVRTAWSRTTVWLAVRYYNVVGALLLGTGVALVVQSSWEFRDGFVLVGLVAVAVGAANGIIGFARLGRARLAAETSGHETRAAQLSHRIERLTVLDTLVVAAAMLAMVRKWRSG